MFSYAARNPWQTVDLVLFQVALHACLYYLAEPLQVIHCQGEEEILKYCVLVLPWALRLGSIGCCPFDPQQHWQQLKVRPLHREGRTKVELMLSIKIYQQATTQYLKRDGASAALCTGKSRNLLGGTSVDGNGRWR
jgi:hypothetical protein